MSWASRGRRIAFGLAVAAALAAVLAIGSELGKIDPEPGVLCFELTFGQQRASEILKQWPMAAKFRAIAAIELDFWFIPAYVLLWLLPTVIASRVLELGGRTRYLVLAAPVLAGGLDVLENIGMLSMLTNGADSWWPFVTSCFALAKFFLLAAGPLLLLAAIWRRATGSESLEHRERLRVSPRKSFAEVRRAELENIAAARRNMGSEPDLSRAPLVGLAFSGGGIRSATFNLGLLQALARLRLLPHIDYLSSVSGGGYIASWLSKWARNSPQSGLTDVAETLGADSEHTGHEPANVSFLRDYSNYLTPRVGMLSADSWTTFATYARNFLLNLVILVGGGTVLLLVPRMTASLLSLRTGHRRPNQGVGDDDRYRGVGRLVAGRSVRWPRAASRRRARLAPPVAQAGTVDLRRRLDCDPLLGARRPARSPPRCTVGRLHPRSQRRLTDDRTDPLRRARDSARPTAPRRAGERSFLAAGTAAGTAGLDLLRSTRHQRIFDAPVLPQPSGALLPRRLESPSPAAVVHRLRRQRRRSAGQQPCVPAVPSDQHRAQRLQRAAFELATAQGVVLRSGTAL